MNENVHNLFGGLTPGQVLEAVVKLNPQAVVVSLIDETGMQRTMVSAAPAATVAFLLMSSQAQFGQFLIGATK